MTVGLLCQENNYLKKRKFVMANYYKLKEIDRYVGKGGSDRRREWRGTSDSSVFLASDRSQSSNKFPFLSLEL